ncbi:MAG TPA: tetratricopeptide repeat protein [Bryobacteraceae bacterium]|nr:tetratricopeptide repeat protein [Bryobacteraceae bacterium]
MTAGLLLLLLAFQPNRAMLRSLFEKALAERIAEYGANDVHTAQAQRDLGLFLQRSGEKLAARKALTEAVRIDEIAFGRTAPQTLEDVASLAAVSPVLQVEPLLKRAAESADPTIAGPALSDLAEIRRNAGDHLGALTYLRRALEKAEAVEGPGGSIGSMLRQAIQNEQKKISAR